MVKIKTKYIILFWILLLILFTFYCIFRIKYIIDKKQEKYANISSSSPSPSSTNINIIDWINNANKTGIITDIKGCEYVYDDNIEVGNLGYSDCKTAYNDYVVKGLDVNNKYGESESLAEICPVSSKSPLYANCLKKLIYKFTNNANIINNINSEITDVLNTRLYDRNKIIKSINIDMTPFMSSSSQTGFNNFMNDNNSVAKTPDDVFNLVGNYYGNRFNSGYNVGYEKTTEGFTDNLNTIDQNTIDLFFGYYTPLAGQFLVFDNINILLYNNTSNDVQESSPSQSPNSQQNNIILSIKNTDGFQLNANVESINKFKNLPNVIVIKISDINIINNSSNTSNSQILQQLLTILGVNQLTSLIITYEEYTSTENVLHKTYKLVNENLDTILLLNKM